MNSERPPAPSKVLFKSIFENNSPNEIIDTISDGIAIIIENARGLLEDADLLKNSNRYMGSSFFSVTAREEIAKTHILVDACRLDFSKHDKYLKGLCKAFYNHKSKYAYCRIHHYPKIADMNGLKMSWKSLTETYWSYDFENGELDSRHPTNYLREMPLYVDFVYWDNEWFNPRAKRGSLSEKSRYFELEDAKDELSRLESSFESGLYNPESLFIINEVYKKHIINESTSTKEVYRLYEKVGQLLENRGTISKGPFLNSFINKWPLYCFCK